ncbi:hypothetical protein AAT19DRAFT_12396 [Rhodotorula toruloides]|uniref:DNA polymerase delta subunit 2 n=1 Tax=Rhodotorula toruloides TaxID=5286 RepID=A0A2T0AG44_RHOTO|nr:hypothetical protein AAT19DRAFT_12396 [Rhodotorula toruloides]
MPTRLTSTYALPDPSDDSRAPFTTSRDDEEFQKQYANLYWQRLTELRARVLSEAKRRWVEGEGFKGASNRPQHVRRLLEVENGKLCYVVGTVYVDMPLKPNVLEDLARDHHITAPATRRKYHSPSDEIMLEDESGRVRLVGSKVDDAEGTFVTGEFRLFAQRTSLSLTLLLIGTIMAALGAEMASGDFEVFEYCFAGMPDQPPLNPTTPEGEWVALASGMGMGTASDVADVRAELLSEWLLGEAGDDEDQDAAVKVTRLILAGNSLAQPDVIASDEPKKKRYGYDSSMYTSKPTETLDAFLSELAPSISIDMMSGEKDPTEPTLPQQPLHPAQQTLEWSHIAPTCPDTLWCYPFSGKEPFVLKQTPHVYFFGNQPSFGTRLVESDDGKKVRIVLVPRFCESGEVVLVNTATLEVKVQRFELLQ